MRGRVYYIFLLPAPDLTVAIARSHRPRRKGGVIQRDDKFRRMDCGWDKGRNKLWVLFLHYAYSCNLISAVILVCVVCVYGACIKVVSYGLTIGILASCLISMCIKQRRTLFYFFEIIC